MPDPLSELQDDRERDSGSEYYPDEESLSSLPPSLLLSDTDEQESQPGPSGAAQTIVASRSPNSSGPEDYSEHHAGDKVRGVKRGPSGANWVIREDDYLPCACGSLIERKRVNRHVSQMCRLQPSPLARVKGHTKQVGGWSRLGSDKKVQCSKCLVHIQAGQKTTIAKAINTHLSKKHRELSSRARDRVRMAIFNNNHVLVANDVGTATVTDLKLDSEVYEEVAEFQTSRNLKGPGHGDHTGLFTR